MNYKNRISVIEASKLMGCNPQFLRIGLQNGAFPFGWAVKTSSQWTYVISKQKFIEYTGIQLEGGDGDETISASS